MSSVKKTKTSLMTKRVAAGGGSSSSGWFASTPAKRETEIFYVKYSVCWVLFFSAIVVTEVYEQFDRWWYAAVGAVLMFPPILISLFAPSWIGPVEASRPWHARFSVQSNAWIFVFSFIGNYFWTHYFYSLLGAKYTMDAHRLNDVPVFLIACTHAYFILYHTLSTMLLRKTRSLGLVFWWALILVMSYVTAYMETWTIERFPYYSFIDRDAMYIVGSMCYALYFVVSFPMYYRIAENKADEVHWTTGRATVDAFGAAMIVTLLLDFWRLWIGKIVDGAVPSQVPFISPTGTLF
ncbi:mitochondrial cycloeucalenol cycloisomerase [Andalucia godoyi]|uniref:Mitochondrial cycloeucalenol cycloisomerase n=1 Tax=Andalucia godoyi TaxID=505711 RepID=A0A8K0AI50_ANDGO|nr:mitochondrial cycloeucalenol cycloisomerase [Andalucia godoyi]|eukprot:ANDGO_04133.mRNA.1 mitochondrial cycloeucalenol cycloisomerase